MSHEVRIRGSSEELEYYITTESIIISGDRCLLINAEVHDLRELPNWIREKVVSNPGKDSLMGGVLVAALAEQPRCFLLEIRDRHISTVGVDTDID